MAKDLYHHIVRKALMKDGWTITHDPLRLENSDINMKYEADLGAEKIFAAEKGQEKIAVEIKSFLKSSIPNEFHSILGQYLTYLDALITIESDRILILAIPLNAYHRLENYPFILHLIEKHKIKTCIFDELTETIVKWKK